MALTVQTVLVGSQSEIPVIFIAEGFKSTEMATFNTYVQNALLAFRTEPPFKTNVKKFGFYKIETVSLDSGISVLTHPTNIISPEIIKTTRWDIFKNYIGLIRYCHLPDSKRAFLYNLLINSSVGPFSDRPFYPVFIVNDGIYAGAGEFKGIKPSLANPDDMSVCIISKDTEFNSFGNLLLHEFAHSFGDLDDEYEDPGYAANAPTYEPDVWYYANRPNVKNTNPGGWFEGARYVPTGKWRSSLNSLMRTVTGGYSGGFGTLNISLLQDRIDDES